MITKALWGMLMKWSPEPLDYLLALFISPITICMDLVLLPLEIIALIIWKIREDRY